MKKYLSLVAICVVTGIGLNINLKFDQEKPEKMGITLDNIEALATGEDSDKKCFMVGSIDCPKSPIKVLYIQ